MSINTLQLTPEDWRITTEVHLFTTLYLYVLPPYYVPHKPLGLDEYHCYVPSLYNPLIS
jgi:hypothetical protein